MPFNSFSFVQSSPSSLARTASFQPFPQCTSKFVRELKMNEKHVVFDVKCMLDRKLIDGRL